MSKNLSSGFNFAVAGNQLYLERPHLDELLRSAVRLPIVTVVAGTGYGKSQAVYSFARKFNVRTAWMQFFEGDNETARFWENFAGAVSALDARSAAHLVEMGFPETERQFNRYLSVPRADLIPGEKYLFVYDDLNLLHNRAVIGFLERSISMPFPNITSVVISRGELPLDFSKMEARGLVAHIAEDDLRFSRSETLEYFSLLGLRPSARTVSDIYRDTEGWAIATHLAALSLKNSRSSDAYVPQALRSNIFNLMESEIFSGLSQRLKTFLIKLSLIEHPGPDLLREIAGGGGQDYSVIDEMEEIGSFVQYDAYLNTYRIHQLFLDFLRDRQSELSEGEKKEIWLKAAAWCLSNNHIVNALVYFERAGDYLKLLDSMYSFPLVFSKQTTALLLRIIGNAPPELFELSPAACVLRSRLLVASGKFERAWQELNMFVSRYEAKPEITVGIARCLAGFYNNLGILGYLTCIRTHDYSFVRYFEKAHEYAVPSGYCPPLPLSVANLGAYVCRVASAEPGEMERHIAALGEMVRHISVSMNGCCYGQDDLARGELFFFRGDAARAEPCLQTALLKARERQQYEIEHCSIYYLLRLNLFRGKSAAIPALLEQADELQNKPFYTNRAIYRDIVCGWFYVQTGRGEKIAAWLKNDFEESDLNSLNHGLEIIVKARYHFAEKRYPAALADLESREDKYGTWSFVMARLEAKVLEALCRYRLNDRAGAFRDLEAAWELAKGNGFIMPFAEMGKDMRSLAGAALKEPSVKIPTAELEKIRRAAALYAKNIFAVSETFRGGAPQAGKTGAAVSPREAAVLSGLSQGLTREEIARVSSISVNTVKSTMRSIFNKLGAINRTDAVRIATEQGIL